jgi:hypothetical protein
MTTITAEQLERTAVVYVRRSTAFQVSNVLRASATSTGWWNGPVNSVGSMRRLSAMIFEGRAAALSDRSSRNCSRRYSAGQKIAFAALRLPWRVQ